MDREYGREFQSQKLNNVKEENDPPTREENVRKYVYIQKLRYVRNHNNQTSGTYDGGLTFLESLFSGDKGTDSKRKGKSPTYLAQSSSCFKILFQSLQG
jgi:hypothetical protein